MEFKDKEKELLLVENLYKELCDQKPRGIRLNGLTTQYRVSLVSKLESILKTDFTNTQDLHQKVRAFLSKGKKPHLTLKKYRKSCGHTQRLMANMLEISLRQYVRMENGSFPLNQKALELIYSRDDLSEIYYKK